MGNLVDKPRHNWTPVQDEPDCSEALDGTLTVMLLDESGMWLWEIWRVVGGTHMEPPDAISVGSGIQKTEIGAKLMAEATFAYISLQDQAADAAMYVDYLKDELLRTESA